MDENLKLAKSHRSPIRRQATIDLVSTESLEKRRSKPQPEPSNLCLEFLTDDLSVQTSQQILSDRPF